MKKNFFNKLVVFIAIISMIISSSFADDIEISTDVGQITHTHGGDTTITIEGTITYLNAALDVRANIGSIINSGTISAETYYGIYATGMTGNITNNGTIKAVDYGIYAERMLGNIINAAGGTIEANYIGIYAWSMDGNITNEANGIISAVNFGIYAWYMDGNIINYGTVSAEDDYGIVANDMIGNITNYGTISAGRDRGIRAIGMEGDITNYGTISAEDYYGIYAELMVGNIINETNGTISAGNNYGIYADSMKGNIINEAGGIISAGVDVGIYAAYMTGNIINNGTISAEAYSGISAYLMVGGITNSGTISAGRDDGITAQDMLGDITNEAGGTISAGGNYGINAYQMGGNIINSGTISAGTTGIYSYRMTGSIINDGIIKAEGSIGIDSYSMTGNIINNGVISAEVGNAIYAYLMVGDIVNAAGGTISADYIGIDSTDMTGDIINSGTISVTGDYGIWARNMIGNIYNYGTIEAGTGTAVLMGSTLYNYAGATIKAGSNTVTVSLRDTVDTIFNEGLIWATGNYGVAINHNGTSELNLIGDGEIIGIIDSATSNLVIPGTVLNIRSTLNGADLDQAFITDWETVNFSGAGISQLQAGAFTSSTDVNIISGGFALGGDTSVNTLNILSGALRTSIDVDAGSAYTLTVDDTSNSTIYSGTNLDIIINGIWKEGVSVTDYRIFIGDMAVANAGNFNLTYSLGYSGTWDETYEWLTLSFYTIPFAEKANAYQFGFAKLMDTIGGYHTEEEVEGVLAEYDYSGYASIVHSQINGLNQRTSSLYNRLSTYESASLESHNSAMATATRPIRDANGNAVWFDIYSYDGSLDGEDNNNLDYDGYEAAIGFDHALNDNMIIGLSFHYSENSGDVGTVKFDSEGYGLDLYAQYQQGQLTHKMLLGLTNYNNDATRTGAAVDFDSDEFYIAYRGEYTISMSSFDLVPVFGLRYAQVNVGSIKEDNDYGLKGYDYTSIQSELGVKLVKELKKAHLWGGISWLQELGDTDVDAKGSSEFGNFDQKGLEADETIFRVSLGLNTQLSDSISFAIEYAHEFGDNTDIDSIDAKISFNF